MPRGEGPRPGSAPPWLSRPNVKRIAARKFAPFHVLLAYIRNVNVWRAAIAQQSRFLAGDIFALVDYKSQTQSPLYLLFSMIFESSGYYRHPCCWRYEYNCPNWVWQAGDACADCQVCLKGTLKPSTVDLLIGTTRPKEERHREPCQIQELALNPTKPGGHTFSADLCRLTLRHWRWMIPQSAAIASFDILYLSRRYSEYPYSSAWKVSG